MGEQMYHRGQIYYVYPRGYEYTGSEQGGGRPAIIVSNDVGNEYSSVVEVVFLTTREKKPLPTHVKIISSRCPSIALCEQIETVDKGRIGNYINEISQAELKGIEKAILISLDIATNIRGSKALETWRKMMESWEDESTPEEATISSSEDAKEAEKGMEVAEIPASKQTEENIDLEAAPEYIRMKTERDVYKEMYMNLLQMKAAM